jgi:hydroxyacylglutathione hydrolase
MRRKVLIALGILILIPVAGIVALFATREPPQGPRVDAGPGVLGVEAGGAYAWIVRTPHGAVLVDAGLDASGTAIVEALRSQGVTPEQVQAVLLTHGHPDHYAAAVLFGKAPVFLGAGDETMLRGDRRHHSRFGKVMSAVMPLPAAPPRVTEVRGGEVLELDGVRFAAIATPGHSPGSMMYLCRNVLFTGDSLMGKGAGVAIAPSLFSEDAARNRASLRQLGTLAFDTIADGHVGVTADARGKLARFLAGS